MGNVTVKSKAPIKWAVLRACGLALFANGLAGQLYAATPALSTTTTLPGNNRNPLVQIYGLPAAPDVVALADQLANSESLPQINFSAANFSLSSQSRVLDAAGDTAEEVILDGELFRSDLALRFKLGARNAVTLNLPYIAHHSGNGDQAIEQFHKVLGLPNGNRDRRAKDLLTHNYANNTGQNLLLERNVQAVGDTSIAWHYLAPRRARAASPAIQTIQPKPQHSLRIGLKLPTGSRSKLSGSGTTDLSVDWSMASSTDQRHAKLGWQTSAGALWLSGGGVLADIRKQWVGYASGGAAYRLRPGAAVKLQLNLHSAFYNSDTDELGGIGGILSIGLNFVLTQTMALDIYFSEDIVHTSSPDFGLGAALRYWPVSPR